MKMNFKYSAINFFVFIGVVFLLLGFRARGKENIAPKDTTKADIDTLKHTIEMVEPGLWKYNGDTVRFFNNKKFVLIIEPHRF